MNLQKLTTYTWENDGFILLEDFNIFKNQCYFFQFILIIIL